MNQTSNSSSDLPDQSKQVIDVFLDALWMERGLSDNTLSAYRSDLYKFASWLHSQNKVSVLNAAANHILAYLASVQNTSTRTVARRLSSLRRLYEYLLRENRIKQNPVSNIDAPRLGRALPKSLTEDEVEALLNAPDIEDVLGIRDKCMLEVLYATGLRVSELVGLTVQQIN